MKSRIKKKKMAIVATVPMMIKIYLTNHIIFLSHDYEITIFTNLHENRNLLSGFPKNIKKYHVPFRRNISLFYDVLSLLILLIQFKKEKFRITYSISPKGGFISCLSAFFARVPIRIHTFTGQVWKLKAGFTRSMLVKIDQITSYCATSLIVDSKTQKNFLIKNKIINDRKSVVLGKGSISGVDTKKFQPNKKSRSQIRKKFKVKKDQIIYLYLGRINEDKGILSLIRAFNNCLKKKY